MIEVRTGGELDALRTCGRANAKVHRAVAKAIQSGITTRDLEDVAVAAMRLAEAKSAIKGVHGFPGEICVSVNSEIGHSVPGAYRLQSGDLVKVDIAVAVDGWITDAARSYVVGDGTREAHRMLEVAEAALAAGIQHAKAGGRCSDISHAIGEMVKHSGMRIIHKAVGHGTGMSLHEDPWLPNFGPPGLGPRLREGMVLAIEPVIAQVSRYARRADNGWADVTMHGDLSVHVEDTVIVRDGVAEVITRSAEEQQAVRVANMLLIPAAKVDQTELVRLVAKEMDPILLEAWGRRVTPHDLFAGGAIALAIQDEDGRLLGFVSYARQGRHLHLHTIVLRREQQGRQRGRAILAWLEGEARRLGCNALQLCVQTNNERALRFYQRLGFVEVGRPQSNTWLMTKRL
ncbi:hypothetical protein Heshes_17510 [Alicyclobacillus hesperidum]|uniref:Methionine aminopeptidase n=1 Tax=Alicyclobacillus hesperidum TaxID=89784 RepID=A0A1H2U5N4_9BACL|nr:type I methionyl aminopeptidase [Alicyclobacillus hesperidum]GLV14067.1 hypothetical protein Heshes_17510 [Alicyclobacillus hesperidum]SDW50804.1 methionine aminopeptidase, type I [Alicyclobacillus hesperidum]